MTNKIPSASVTQDIIREWKEKYGKVTTWKSKSGKQIWFRSPTRQEIAAAQKIAETQDGITSNQVLAKATCIGGDVEILEEQKVIIGLGKHLSKIIEVEEGEFEDL